MVKKRNPGQFPGGGSSSPPRIDKMEDLMGKAVKWIIGIFAVLAGLLIVAAFTLPLLIDPNDYKGIITRKVQEQTGRELSIPGDISLDVSLLGLQTMFSLGDVKLSSSPAFPDTEFFSSRQVEIDLALWPLISGKELKVNNLRLEGVNVNLVRNEDGSSNWEDLAGTPQTEPTPPGTEAPPPPKKETPALAGIDIGGIQVKDINVSLEDRQAGRTVRLSDFNLDVGHIRDGAAFPLTTDFDLFLDDGKQQPIHAGIDTGASLTIFPDRQRFQLDGLTFKAAFQGGALPVPELTVALNGDIDMDLGGEKIEARKLTFNMGDLRMESTLTLNGFAAPSVAGSINLAQFSPRALAERIGLTLPLADPQSLTALAAEMDFALDQKKLTVSRLLLNLDQTTVEGTASITDPTGQPVYGLTARVNQFDLDRYTVKKTEEPDGEAAPIAGPTAAPAAAGTRTAASAPPLIPVELLRGLNFTADLRVDTFKAAKMHTTDIVLKADGRDGLIRLAPLAADLYGGKANVSGDLDSRPAVPSVKLAATLDGVQLGPMLLDMTGREEVKGRADIKADITTRGLTEPELKRNANGTVNLALADGEIAKLKIIDTIRTARTLIGSKDLGAVLQQQSAQASSGRPTAFAALTASGVITNGVFRNNDLIAESELMKVTGKGTVDLVNERIDYLLTIFLARAIDRDQETGLVDLTDTPIPYRVKGTFDNIEQSAALEEILKAGAKKTLLRELEKKLGAEKTEDEAQKEPASGAEELIQRGLKGLFGK